MPKKIAANEFDNFGDTSTVAGLSIVDDIVRRRKQTLERENA